MDPPDDAASDSTAGSPRTAGEGGAPAGSVVDAGGAEVAPAPLRPDDAAADGGTESSVAGGGGYEDLEDDDPGPPPDGGYGWWLVLACFFLHFVVFGPQWAFGVYQRYFTSAIPGATVTTVSLIGALSSACCPLWGPVSGRLTDLFGGRIVCAAGAVILGASFLAASFCTEVWQLAITQGFLFGTGQSFAWFPYMSAIPQWFGRRRGLAIGLCVSGTGVGGLCFGPFTQYMIDRYSVAWAQRATALIQVGVVGICVLLLRARYSVLRGKQRKVIDLSFFRNKHFTVMWFAFMCGLFGMFIPLFFASTYAAFIGLSPSDGALVVGLMNLGNTIGRIGIGIASDKIGPFTAFASSIFLAGLSMLLFWPFATTLGTLIAFGMVYAFFSGGFVSLQSPTLAEIVGLNSIASAMGLMYFAGAAASLAGPPIAGALVRTDTYLYVQMFGGTMMTASGVVMAWVRMDRAGWVVRKRV
ncbi:major facilitator superfamily domain-containing protein [Hyaloraphidium curvatum]|nr:major facilitator superfamily domain-containing protein [Hyaloraphidium curvatum]